MATPLLTLSAEPVALSIAEAISSDPSMGDEPCPILATRAISAKAAGSALRIDAILQAMSLTRASSSIRRASSVAVSSILLTAAAYIDSADLQREQRT
jgi:hypothetical protein